MSDDLRSPINRSDPFFCADVVLPPFFRLLHSTKFDRKVCEKDCDCGACCQAKFELPSPLGIGRSPIRIEDQTRSKFAEEQEGRHQRQGGGSGIGSNFDSIAGDEQGETLQRKWQRAKCMICRVGIASPQFHLLRAVPTAL
jgi:hypothetical protein